MKNVVLSFPHSEEKRQKSCRVSIEHLNAKQRKHPVQLVSKISGNCCALIVSKKVSF